MLSPVPQPTGIPARSPSASAAAAVTCPATASCASTSGSSAGSSSTPGRPSTSSQYRPVTGSSHALPDASPRSVTPAPQRRSVRKSCGSRTAATCGTTAGSFRTSHAHFVTVNDATGTQPVVSAHHPAPRSPTSRAASAALRVSFHSSAGRSGRPARSRTTSPCCWPPTEIASISAARPVA